MKIGSLLIKPAGPDCNLNCTYCFYNCKGELFPDGKMHRMTGQTLERVILEYLQNCDSTASIGWQGGEPTLAGLDFFEKAVYFINKYRRRDQQVSLALQTNGMLLDSDWAAFFKKNNFLVGLSIDGPAEIHDLYRVKYDGTSSHETVAKNMQMLKKYGVEFNTLTVVSKSNVGSPDEIFDCLKDSGSGYMQFIPCVEIDRSNDVAGIAAFSISPEEYGNFLCRIFDRWIGDGMPQCYVRLFDELLISYVEYKTPSCNFAPSCMSNLVIEHNGNIYPCDFFVDPGWYLGNINDQSMADIMKNPKLEQFVSRKKDVDVRCRSCKWFSLCFGDCCKYRLNEQGLRVNYAYFCEGYKNFFEYSRPGMLELKKRLLSGNDPKAAAWRNLEGSMGRNDNCACGSGLKYKKCCLQLKSVL